MGRIQKLKKYKKEAQRKVEAVIGQTIKPEPKNFFKRWIYRLAWRVVMVDLGKKK